MGNKERHLYEFGPFRLDPDHRLLLREGKPVPLQSKAFDVLLVLIQNSEKVVAKDDLMKAVWPATFVEESNLAQHIFALRKALGDAVGSNHYIVTVPGRGYRFAENVQVVADGAALSHEGQLVIESHTRSRLVVEEQGMPVHALLGETRSLRRSVLQTILLLTAGAVVAFIFRPLRPPPRVTRVRQLTRSGTLIHNTQLVTDGPRIYFRVWEGGDRGIRSMSAEGGDVFPISKAFPQIDIDDIAPNGSEFLAVDLADLENVSNANDLNPRVWRVPVPIGSPRPVGALHAHEAKWSPDGRTIACAIGTDLALIKPDGSSLRKVASLPGTPFYLVWSPDGTRLRFSVRDPQTNTTDLWQADVFSRSVGRLLPERQNYHGAVAGGWTHDGRYFFYSAWDEGTRNVWAIHEKADMLHRVSHAPVQLTTGPLTFYVPFPGKDGKTIFAVGEQSRGQLVRFDAASRQYVPYAQGISADHVSFSRQGDWIAYVEYPEGVLVRSRLDGTDRQQLTFPPMRVLSPQWSPDGTQIAFQASSGTGAINKIYLVSNKGGVPALAAPNTGDRQTYPSWAADGRSILFSSSDQNDSNAVLRKVDLESERAALLPGSEHLYWGQLSPDGLHVVALEESTHKLMLYDVNTHKVRTLAEFADYPLWSADGKFVYFSTFYLGSRMRTTGVYRLRVSSATTETLVQYPDFRLSGIWGISYGVTPSGEVLLLRDLSTRDLYALDVDLP